MELNKRTAELFMEFKSIYDEYSLEEIQAVEKIVKPEVEKTSPKISEHKKRGPYKKHAVKKDSLGIATIGKERISTENQKKQRTRNPKVVEKVQKAMQKALLDHTTLAKAYRTLYRNYSPNPYMTIAIELGWKDPKKRGMSSKDFDDKLQAKINIDEKKRESFNAAEEARAKRLEKYAAEDQYMKKSYG